MTRGLSEEARRVRERLDRERATAHEAVVLREHIEKRVRARRRRPWFILAPLAASAAVLGVALLFERDAYDGVHGDACVSRREGDVVVSVDCASVVRLRVDAGELEVATGGAVLRREPDAMRLVKGLLEVRVDPRAQARPFRVRVSHGTIEARGTSFTVEQRDNSGRVRLATGEISFAWADGSGSEILTPGDSLSWPRVASTLPPMDEPTPRPRPRLGTPPAPPLAEEEPHDAVHGEPIGDVLRRLSQLGSQRRFADAVTLLRQGLERPDFTPEQKERLSFELGLVFADKMGDEMSACAHWRAHLAIYPAGVRSERVRALLRACD